MIFRSIKYSPIYLLLMLMSCTNGNVAPSFIAESKDPRLEKLQDECEQLQSTKFKDAEQYLLSPIKAAKKHFYEPHWWSHWKKELNFLENDIPQGIVLYSGTEGDDYASGNTMVWKNCKLSQYESFSFTKNGNLLEHIDIDSTLFHYDTKEQLRKTVSYNYSGDTTDIDYIRMYDYDDYGNIIWCASFFQEPDDDSIYLNYYSNFQYFQADSGTYVKERHYFINIDRIGSLDKSVKISFFDNKNVLRREFHTFTGGQTAVTLFSYNEYQGDFYLTEKEQFSIYGEPMSVETTLRDSKNRIISESLRLKGILGPIHKKDSIQFYNDSNESYSYHFDYSNAYRNNLFYEKFDDFGNPIEVRSSDSHSKKNLDFSYFTKTKYETLKNGTWYSAEQTSVYTDDGEDPEKDYLFRKFRNDPVHSTPTVYENDTRLFELIELYVLKYIHN